MIGIWNWDWVFSFHQWILFVWAGATSDKPENGDVMNDLIIYLHKYIENPNPEGVFRTAHQLFALDCFRNTKLPIKYCFDCDYENEPHQGPEMLFKCSCTRVRRRLQHKSSFSPKRVVFSKSCLYSSFREWRSAVCSEWTTLSAEFRLSYCLHYSASTFGGRMRCSTMQLFQKALKTFHL